MAIHSILTRLKHHISHSLSASLHTRKRMARTGLGMCMLLAAGLSGCSDEGDLITPNYTDGATFIAYNSADNYKGSHDVRLARSSALEFCKVEGVQPTDEFAARNKETGELTFLDWGYKYAGLQGDEDGYYQRVYYNDTILVGLGYADNWRATEYDLLLLRGNRSQTLDSFNFCILTDIEIDLSKMQGGVISIKANGWDDPGTGIAIDSLEFVEKATGNVVYKKASDCKGNGTAFEMTTFDRSKFVTGDYELYVARWNDGLRQKICEFNYFNYSFVDSDPLGKDAEGRYQVKFYVKEFVDGDNFTITTKSPYANYYVDQRIPFDENCYDAATKVYTYTLVEDCWRNEPVPGIEFAVSLTIGGIRTNVTGVAKLGE